MFRNTLGIPIPENHQIQSSGITYHSKIIYLYVKIDNLDKRICQ